MLLDLPQSLQQQIIYYLEAHNFKAAKELHDRWLLEFATPTEQPAL